MSSVCLPFPIKTKALWYSKMDEVDKKMYASSFQI